MERQEEKVALQESWQNEWHDIKFQGMTAKAPPCPERTLKTPLPQQSSSSPRDEESQWVTVEEVKQLGISEEAGVSIKQDAQQARNENGQKIFFKFSGKEKKMYALPAWPDGTRSSKIWLS